MGTIPPSPPPSTRLKLCRDCAHFIDAGILSMCGSPMIDPGNLATGARPMASGTRSFGKCGKEAKYFEPRLPDGVDQALEPIAPRASWWVRLQVRIWKWARS